MQLEYSFLSPQSPQRVFNYLAQFHRVAEWDPSVVRSEKVTPGVIAVGTEFDIDVRFLGRTSALIYTLEQWDEPWRLVLRGRAEGYQVTDTITLELTPNDGTRLRYVVDIRYEPKLQRFESLLAPRVRRSVEAAVDGLKRALRITPEPVRHYPEWRDRALLPGAWQFTRYGFLRGRKHWQGLNRDLSGRNVLITGATSGLGRATTLALAQMGANVIAVARSAAKAGELQRDVRHLCGREIEVELADLVSLQQTAALAARIQARSEPLHVLINNAGALFNAREETGEGLERSFALLLASPFLLTEMLLPSLQLAGSARVINVVSGGLYTQAVQPDDWQYRAEPYDGAKAYARAKRGLLDMTRWWAAHAQAPGVVFHAMHPGWADTEALRQSLPGFHRIMRPFLRSAEQGADTIIWLAVASEVLSCTGEFWLDRAIHTSAVLPNTESSPQIRQRVYKQLCDVVGRWRPVYELIH